MIYAISCYIASGYNDTALYYPYIAITKYGVYVEKIFSMKSTVLWKCWTVLEALRMAHVKPTFAGYTTPLREICF